VDGQEPEWFDVIVTGNMFGDIITDLGAITQGGMGIAAGGNINPEGVSMFEPIGGSAPKYTGQNIINPLAAICAGQMMLETLGEEKAAARIEKAVMRVVSKDLKSLSAGRMGKTTSQVGDLVAKYASSLRRSSRAGLPRRCQQRERRLGLLPSAPDAQLADAAGERLAADHDAQRHPEQVGVLNFTPGRSSRSSQRTSMPRPSRSATRRSASARTAGSVSLSVTRWTGTGRAERPDDPVGVVVLLDRGGHRAPGADPVAAHDADLLLPSSSR